MPIVLVPGIRLVRGRDSGRWGRAALLTLLTMLLAGTAATLFREGANLALPAGWGGGLGFLGAEAIDAGLGLIPASGIVAPLHTGLMIAGAGLGLWLWLVAIGLEADERAWLIRWGRKTQTSARSARPRKAVRDADPFDDEDDARVRRSRPRPRGAAHALAPRHRRSPGLRRHGAARRRQSPGLARSARRICAAVARSAGARARLVRAGSRQGQRSNAMPGCSKPCSTTSTSRAASSRCAPARSSRCTSSSPRPASRRAA